MAKPYYRLRYSEQRANDALRILRDEATLVVPDLTVRGVADDEEDDLTLGTAVAGNVDFLVTGDKPLQRLGRYRDVVILSPRQFLEYLESETNQPI